MSYQLIWNGKGVTAEFKGTLDDSELREILFKFYSNSKFDEIDFLIINLLPVEKFEVTSSALVSVGAMDTAASISNPEIRMAVITNNEAILKLFESYEEGAASCPWEVKYFPSVSDANEWLLA